MKCPPATVLMIMAMLPLNACSGTAAETSGGSPAARAGLYDCEGCEGVHEADPAKLAAAARIGPETEPGEPLQLSGTVMLPGGNTPAANVVIYAYQTNADGLYANGGDGTEWSRRHGNLRGWVKTGPDGKYLFETVKPAPYPQQTMPAHVHFTILEEGRPPYWIDDIVFDGEFGVTSAYRGQMTNKGGNGIIPLTRNRDGKLQAVRNIILERHPDTEPDQ